MVASRVVSPFLVARALGVTGVVRRLEGEERKVALTFDDGPDPLYTPRVLEVLESRNARGTFFLIGKKAERHPRLVREIEDRGHEVALHGHQHRWFYALQSEAEIERDLERELRALRELGIVRPRFFRPPIGVVSPPVARATRRLGLSLVTWSVRGLDGFRHTPRVVFRERIKRGLRGGSIVQLHDAPEIAGPAPLGVRDLKWLLARALERELTCVTLSGLLPEGDQASTSGR